MDTDHLTQSIDDDANDGIPSAPAQGDEPAVVEEAPVAARPPTVSRLRRERRQLWELRQESVYHLGGLALELHARTLLGDDLLVLRAEVIAEMDHRMVMLDELLAEADDRRRRRRVRVVQEAPVGYCMSCGAPHQAEASFCFRCGARIHIPADDGDTQVIAVPDSDAR